MRKEHLKAGISKRRALARLAAGLSLGVLAVLLLRGAAGALGAEPGGANDPQARFHGGPTYDFGVTNVRWEAATPEYSYVTFDLSWSFSWRVKWTEPAATSATGKDMEIENWDAAWVFVKFLPEKDSEAAKERNHWQHATLAKDPTSHVMPAGATNSVKLSDDGTRGMGVFIYRDAVGSGVNDFKSVKLRWNHGPATFNPAKAAVRVYAIPMVYVPEGPFKLGEPAETGFCPFADGPDIPKTRYDGEQNFMEIPEVLRKAIETTTSKDGGPYLRWTKNNRTFQFTDGAWRGGKAIPFLLDKEWNGPFAEGTRGRRIGPVAGWFWGTHTFSERGFGATFGGEVGGTTALNDDYPTGYDAFYCMKYDVTQGQYCDYLNSLPPDVAAGRAFVSTEEWASYGTLPSATVKDKLPSGKEMEVTELAGNTIRSSADRSAQLSDSPEVGAETKKKDDMDLLIEDAMAEKKNDGTKVESIPVYWARCPFRRLLGFGWNDIRAFAVWAGLRPMTGLEATKAGGGCWNSSVPPPPPSSYDAKGNLEMADVGEPNERPVKGLSDYGADFGVRVGCFSTPTSDQATARATYWGISELACMTVPLFDYTFRGSHGNGIMPVGKPGAPWKRGFVAFTNTPPDWGHWDEYCGGRHAHKICRLVVSANNRIMKSAGEVAAPVYKRKLAAQFPPADARRDDIPRVTNVKIEAGKEYSTVSFDLSWKNSWRAKWTEPAEKNVTGKPLTVESWDAAWVIVKFRPVGAKDEGPAMLATAKQAHQVPAGAELEVGLTDDGTRGVGVFVYRNAIGFGPNDFKSVKLRWTHPPSSRPQESRDSGATSGGAVDPTQGEVKVYAIAMVYIPEGPFASRSPWGHPLTIITTPDATQPGGYLDSGTNEAPRNAEWPNGYTSFYCMKYSISQGQYADMLNSTPSGNFKVTRRFVGSAIAHNNARRWHPAYYGFNGYTITTNAAGVFKADVPDRMCPLLTEADITFFTVWAGLRLMTDLEYEKVCRGPRAVAKGGEAWTPATCGPAAGLDKSVLDAPSAVGPGPSYWGIRELSLSGCVQEWPSVVASLWGWGKNYRGTHSTGAMEDPDDWPCGWFANLYYGGIWRCPGYGTVGHWINADEYDRMPWEVMDGERCGRYGVRVVRTVAGRTDQESPLQVDALPNLAGYDIALLHLSGRFNNTGDKPLKLALASTLPNECFPEGGASRLITAAPKAVTPFKILAAVSSRSAAGAVRRSMFLPVRIEGAGGEALAEQMVLLKMGAPAGGNPVIESLQGGEVALRITNATPRAVTLAIRMSPAGVKLAETNRSVTVAAGGEARVAFPIRRQAFITEGECRIPYTIAVSNGAPQSGEAIVGLRTVSRWWTTKKVKTGPKLAAGDDLLGGGEDISDGMSSILNNDSEVFKADKPLKNWQPLISGAVLRWPEGTTLPSHGSSAVAATRVEAPPGGQEVVLKTLQEKAAVRFGMRAWFNDQLVFEWHPPKGKDGKPEETAKPFRFRAAGNTLVVECMSEEDGAATPGNIVVEVSDAKSGKPVNDLLFDMDKR